MNALKKHLRKQDRAIVSNLAQQIRDEVQAVIVASRIDKMERLSMDYAIHMGWIKEQSVTEELPAVTHGWTWGVGGQQTAGKGGAVHFYGMGTIAGDLAIENSLGARLTAAS